MIPLLFTRMAQYIGECAKSDARIGIVGPRLINQNLMNSTKIDKRQLGRYILPDRHHMIIGPSNDTVTSCTT